MEETLVWENKLANDRLAAMIAVGELDGGYWPQLEMQMMVSGAERALFTICDGEKITAQLWYESKPERRQQIISGWHQFKADMEGYQHVEAAPVAVAAPIKDLPAVVLTVSGALTIETNFKAWGVELRNFIERIPEKPSTSQEFADCKAAIAAFKKAEAQLDAEESRILSLVPDVDKMKRDKQLLRDLSSTTRLALEKLVARREIDVKVEIIQEGKDALAAHIAGLNKRLAKVQMPPIDADFAAAIKSKRNPELMRDAVSTLVANKKIEASATADRIDVNLKSLHDGARPDGADYAFLFADFAQLIMKAPDDLALVIKSRISDHKDAEAKKLEAIKAAARVEAEANAAAKAEQEAEDARRQKAIDDEAAQQRAAAEAAAKIERDRLQATQATPTTVLADKSVADANARAFVDSIPTAEPASPRFGGSGSIKARPITTAINPAHVAEKISRPDDHMIIGILSTYFRVHESKVVEWLLDMDLKAASDNLCKEFAA